MAGYVALVHKDKGTSYGVSFLTCRGASRLVTRSRKRLPMPLKQSWLGISL